MNTSKRERRRATLRTIGAMWRLSVTAAGREIYSDLIDGASTDSEIHDVHMLADALFASRFHSCAAKGWREVGDAWTTELTEREPVAVSERAQLLNVAELREQLERLERHGLGDWEIDLAPAGLPANHEIDLAFELRRYGIVKVDALGDGSNPFVLVTFAPAV